MNRTITFLVSTAALLAGSSGLQATDTAFWTPYQTDDNTYALVQFDDAPLAKVEGKMTGAEKTGDAEFAPTGKFGGALRVAGNGALKLATATIFAGGNISLEAWVKLEKYPAKEACLIYRPAIVDGNASVYDPKVDTTKGFALLVDAKGAFHLETVNCFYGWRTRTSSPAGVVPLNQWVHLAGVSDGFPVAFRRLFCDGKEVAAVPIAWGQGIMVYGDEETVPAPIWLGNSDKGDAGLCGWLDQVRVHSRIVKFWPPTDNAWCTESSKREIPVGPPYFLDKHPPQLRLTLDDTAEPAGAKPDGLKVTLAKDGRYVPGVHGHGWQGRLNVTAPQLLNLNEGTVEFWFQPLGFNNLSDCNVNLCEGPFGIYVYNGGGFSLQPLSLYFYLPGGGLHMMSDTLGVEMYPGAWYHIIATWKGKDLALYLNGALAVKSGNQDLTVLSKDGFCNSFTLCPYGSTGIVDEVYAYRKALLPEEVANAYQRNRDPAKLRTDVRENSVDLKAQYLPGEQRLYYQFSANLPPEQIRRVRLSITEAGGKTHFKENVAFTTTETELKLPDLPDGTYTLAADAESAEGKIVPGGTFRFVRKHFPWEGNQLGITHEVYPPFTPVTVTKNVVGVVGRTYTMNSFGLWDQVNALGQYLLAKPMQLRYTTAAGEGAWQVASGKWSTTRPDLAVFKGTATADPVTVRTVSSLEVDGCMKVELELAPGPKPAEITALWLEIPIKEAAAPLLHTIGDGLRSNYSGNTPAGTGVVWDGSTVARSGSWRNFFVPYIWLGAEERGLCWFGENDKGWITAKNKSKVPTHTLTRDGAQVILKVYFINRPVTIKETHSLVFGLQASPTKPMPADWRQKLPYIPGGLAVVPWGGLGCPSMGPYRDDWSIVDKLLECRDGKQPFNTKWLADYAAAHHPPLVHGTWNWTDSASRYNRTWMDLAEMAKGYSTLGGSAGVQFGPTYRDFAVWMAQEWLKRGVSLYWDNTYPKLVDNYRTTAAYLAEDGQIQPCLILWNQREYQKRVWNVLKQCQAQRPEPLEWVLHMTNTLVLPIMTWGTVDLDHELGRDTPFPPDWLRTETSGRQVGNYPLSLYAVTGASNKVFSELRKTRSKAEVDQLTERCEWGMRAVHEIQHSGPLEKILTDFGYATAAVTVQNYWEDTPVVVVAAAPAAAPVKWLALVKPQEKSLLLILASWTETETTVQVTINWPTAGLSVAGLTVTDAETGAVLLPDAATGPITVKLPAPYGVALLRFAPAVATGNK